MEFSNFRFGTILILASLCYAVSADPQPTPPNLSACNLPAVTGPCLALLPRYHFEISTGKCRLFTYGGCQGNANNFETLRECQAYGRRCLRKAPPAPLPTRRPLSDHEPLDLKWVGRHPVTGPSGVGSGWSQ